MPEKPAKDSFLESEILKKFFDDSVPSQETKNTSPKSQSPEPSTPFPAQERVLKDYLFSEDPQNAAPAVRVKISSPVPPAVAEPELPVQESPKSEAVPVQKPVPEKPEIQISTEAVRPAAEKPADLLSTPSSPVSAPESAPLVRRVNLGAMFALFFLFMGLLLAAGVLWHASINRAARQKAAEAPVQAPTVDNFIFVAAEGLCPEGVKISAHSEKNGKLSLDGSTASQPLILNFVDALNGSHFFKNASIASLHPEGKYFYEFKIYADIVNDTKPTEE